MLVRPVAAAAVATLALALSSGTVLAAQAPDAVPDAPVTSSLQESTEEADGAVLWVGVVTGISGIAALAFSVRRPRISDA